MNRDEMRRALAAVSQAIESGERIDKPRATAKAVGRGARAKPRHIAAIMKVLEPLLNDEAKSGFDWRKESV